jgi:hypothetical protein
MEQLESRVPQHPPVHLTLENLPDAHPDAFFHDLHDASAAASVCHRRRVGRRSPIPKKRSPNLKKHQLHLHLLPQLPPALAQVQHLAAQFRALRRSTRAAMAPVSGPRSLRLFSYVVSVFRASIYA